MDPATFDVRYTLLSLGATSSDAPVELGAFDSPGFVSLRSVQGSHYFFWEEDGPGPDVYWVLPFEGGQMKAARQLTPPGESHDVATCGAHGSLVHPEASCRYLSGD